VRIAVAEAAEADPAQPLVRLPSRLDDRHAAELEPGGDVGQRRAPGHQRLGLEHVAGAPVDAGELLAEHAHRAAAGLEQARSHVQQRALAAAGRPTTLTNSPGAIDSVTSLTAV